MIVLAIHTAGPACDLAVLQDGAVLAVRQEAMLRGQDARLPQLVQDTLSDANVSLDQVDRFAVVTGPGSFTGIRVGVAFARGLALATGKPCIGVTSMEAALPAGQQGSAIVALPAQKRAPDVTFWTQTFRTGTSTGSASEMVVEDLINLLRDRPHMVYGDVSALEAHLPDTPIHAATPSAVIVGRLAATLDPEVRTARPTYVRAPDAALPKVKPGK